MSGLDPVIVAVFGSPPTGIDLNEERGTRDGIVTGVLLFFTILAVIARLAAKKIGASHLYADDYTIIVALILCIGTASINILFGPDGGAGHHIWSLTKEKVNNGLKITFIFTFFWVLTVSITKLSIILLYRRIFAAHKTAFRFWLDFLACVVVCQMIAITVGNLTVCRPLSYSWHKLTPGAHGVCFDQAVFLLASGIINGILDVIILITPLPKIWWLNISMKKRLGICAVLLLGCLVCIASWIRVSYFVQRTETKDITWIAGETSTWSFIETSVGIISACLPIMRPLYMKIHSNYSQYKSSRKSSNVKSGGSAGAPASAQSAQRAGIHKEPKDAISFTTSPFKAHSDEIYEMDRILMQSEVQQAKSYT